MSKQVNVLIVDDQLRARQSLKALLATWPLIGESKRPPTGKGQSSASSPAKGKFMATTPSELTNTPLNGLTEAEVNQRRSQRLGNKATPPTGRTYAQIFRENIFTFINTVILTLAIALVFAGRPSRLVL